METTFVEIVQPGIRLHVDLDKLAAALQEISEEALLEKTRQQIAAGKFGLAERNAIIVRLARSQMFTRKQIAACFGVGAELIRQLAAAAGFRQFPSPTKLYRREVEQRIAYLKTPEGQRLVRRLMAQVATDLYFWAEIGRGRRHRGRLATHRVIEALGFRGTGDYRCRRIWEELIANEIITESHLPGIVIRYGLQMDPQKYLEQVYWSQPWIRQEDVVRAITTEGRQRKINLVPFSQQSLSDDLRRRQIPTKTRGSWPRERRQAHQAGR